MTVYVDDAIKEGPTYTCRLSADHKSELHQFALEVVHLRREWFKDATRTWHYEINEGRRTLALKNGAKSISRQEMSMIMARRVVNGTFSDTS